MRHFQILFLFFVLLITVPVRAQKFVVEKSHINFFSDATIEDITADNKKAAGIFNSANGEIVFSVPISEFQFAKSLMQEHFNEKYMESDKYPRSQFQGKILQYTLSGNPEQEVKASGKLTIHGVTRDIEIPGTIRKEGDKLLMKSKFIVKLSDYNIEIPQLLWQNIAEQVDVTLEFTFRPQ